MHNFILCRDSCFTF